MYFGKYVLGYLPKRVRKGIVIYGTGESGRQLASSLVHSSEFKLLFFISDKESFWGGTIDGFRVKSLLILNDPKKIDQINEIWLALPNISVIERRKLIRNLGKAKLHVRTLPTFSDLTNDRVHLSDIRELDINDLLERDPVKPNEELLRKCIFKK